MTHAGWFILGCSFLAQVTGAPSGAAPASGGGEHVLWAIVLLGMAVALFFAELFVPSGGIIGALAALCLIGGIVMLFWIDTTLGLVGAIVSLAAIPFAFAAGLWIWPSTPIGRALILGGSDDGENSALDGQATPDVSSHHANIAIGTRGKTLTELRPVGTCLLDGKRCECLSVAGVIEPGIEVKVVAADGMQVKVRPVEQD